MEHASINNQPLSLSIHPERRLLPPRGNICSIDFHVKTSPAPVDQKQADRTPLNLALVLDRSGSMQGDKIRSAKQAALAVIEQLTEQDTVSVIVFDNQIDTIQPSAPATKALKKQVQQALMSIEARASTALHEGWLTGCNTLVATPSQIQRLSRCFLLTDGIANIGITDPEQIATEAAGIRQHTGISTSTFGIGRDYNELLLGPMAVAGGGQFHHLRTAHDIFDTFIGELGSLLTIAARQVRLELAIDDGIAIDIVSPYWKEASECTMIAIGDLQHDEERHVVMQLTIPGQQDRAIRSIRARLHWHTNQGEHRTDWQEIRLSYASQSAFENETRDPQVLHWVGLHQADRARREAIAHNNRGDYVQARKKLKATRQTIEQFAGSDQHLNAEIATLHDLEQEIAAAPLPTTAAKELYYEQQRRSRGQSDYRSKPDTK